MASKDDASDLTSQVFYNALLNIKKYSHKGLPFSSWLYRIAVNESNQLFRKQKKQQHIVLDDTNINILSEEIHFSEEPGTTKLLHGALQSLKKAEINIIELRFFEGLSFKEVGEILKITENNAKVKCYRVLDKLRIKMESK
jgi:RNA polymerase sigma-70 factor (ECF subfamily)